MEYEVTVELYVDHSRADRLRLPCSYAFDRMYFCCHKAVQHRTMVDCTVDEVDSPIRRTVANDALALCCQRDWAVACFYHALRLPLKREIPCRDQFMAVWTVIQEKLAAHFQVPDIAGSFALQREISEERQRNREERRAAEQRMRAARSFTADRRSSFAAAELPECLKRLGFTVWPISEGQLRKRYRQLATTCHPDHGGCAREFANLTRDFETGLVIVKRRSS